MWDKGSVILHLIGSWKKIRNLIQDFRAIKKGDAVAL